MANTCGNRRDNAGRRLEASVGARLRDFRKKKFGSHVVEHRRDETADGLWWIIG